MAWRDIGVLPKVNREKYENAILYFIQHCGNEYLGLVKLNKLLYYLDFITQTPGNKNTKNSCLLAVNR